MMSEAEIRAMYERNAKRVKEWALHVAKGGVGKDEESDCGHGRMGMGRAAQHRHIRYNTYTHCTVWGTVPKQTACQMRRKWRQQIIMFTFSMGPWTSK